MTSAFPFLLPPPLFCLCTKVCYHCLSVRNGNIICIVGPVWMSTHLPYNALLFLHLYHSSVWKVPLFSLFSLFHPSLMCGLWSIIMSVGKAMARLCALEGLPTHCLKENDAQAWIPPNPLFKQKFRPHHQCSAQALQDSIVSVTHTHKHTKGRGDNKDLVEHWVWYIFLHLWIYSDRLNTGTGDPHLTTQIFVLQKGIGSNWFQVLNHQVVMLVWLICLIFFKAVWQQGHANIALIWAVTETAVQVPACWFFPS